MPFLTRLRAEMAMPIVYVTHAMDEVSRLADTIVLMNQGRVMFSGPLSVAVSRGDLPLAQRDDAAAILSMMVTEHDEMRRLTRLEGAGITLYVPKIPHVLHAPVQCAGAGTRGYPGHRHARPHQPSQHYTNSYTGDFRGCGTPRGTGGIAGGRRGPARPSDARCRGPPSACARSSGIGAHQVDGDRGALIARAGGAAVSPRIISRIRAGSVWSITRRAKRAHSSPLNPRTACLTRGTAEAFMLKLRNPNPSSRGVSLRVARHLSAHGDRHAHAAAPPRSRTGPGAARPGAAGHTDAPHRSRRDPPPACTSSGRWCRSRRNPPPAPARRPIGRPPGVSIMMPSGGSTSGSFSPRRRSRRATRS